MNFCSSCNNRLTKQTIGDVIILECLCGRKTVGSGRDTLVYTIDFDSVKGGDTKRQTENAVFDPVNLRIAETCDKCGRPYKTAVRSATDETLIKACVCEVKS